MYLLFSVYWKYGLNHMPPVLFYFLLMYSPRHIYKYNPDACEWGRCDVEFIMWFGITDKIVLPMDLETP